MKLFDRRKTYLGIKEAYQTAPLYRPFHANRPFQLPDRRVPASTYNALPSDTRLLHTRRYRVCRVSGGFSIFSGFRVVAVFILEIAAISL
jgi:hypothetical protein